MEKYIDLLLVEDDEKNQHLVTAPSYKADVGAIVRFMGGAIGTVVKCVWMNPADEVYDLISAMFPIFEAETIYLHKWQKEETDAAS